MNGSQQDACPDYIWKISFQIILSAKTKALYKIHHYKQKKKVFELWSVFFLFRKLFTIGSFSERFEKIGRGSIKILETWQFGFIQYHKTRIFWFGHKNFLSVLWSCTKKNRKITLLAINIAFFHRFSWLSTFLKVIWWFFDFYCILRNFLSIPFFKIFSRRR
jgi:hypothetical protein